MNTSKNKVIKIQLITLARKINLNGGWTKCSEDLLQDYADLYDDLACLDNDYESNHYFLELLYKKYKVNF